MQTYRTGFAHPLDELRDEFDRFWENLVAVPPLQGRVRPASTVFPAVNVRETDGAVIVEAELPGLDANTLDIAVTGEDLTVKGSRPEATATEGNGERKAAVTWHRRERGSGGFERRITLPVAVDSEKVEAKLVAGVLTITCPKAPEAQPRKVQVRSA